ncbi:hypothetical protein P775_21850 [Puniceibacterium antarcticum]|uniref:Uncharacterized protein n=1 Tax=Puniceibacterium antarcticum TaxID=1206336 RepID=A0A2G8RAA7_9RHOB|nr:hypothetical protein P775_21850 [Puniceibacterium antarcticum]
MQYRMIGGFAMESSRTKGVAMKSDRDPYLAKIIPKYRQFKA